jgi:glycosyltransferase involved in cell wall biosynthesis
MVASISKMAPVQPVTGTLLKTGPLRMSVGTVLSFVNLFAKSFTHFGPSLIDINALSCMSLKSKKKTVVDFRTPFPVELRWLGHNTLSAIAQSVENSLNDVELVTASNELMAAYCSSLGAKNVKVVPNYPGKDFKATVGPQEFRNMRKINPDAKIALFTGGVRLREIYGIDMLVETWKMIEQTEEAAYLVILGNDSIDYIKEAVKKENLKHVILPGKVSNSELANWINCADVCLAPRTLGFPSSFYNDKDSTKISEYAALKKPIVATGYAPSNQYFLTNQNFKEFGEGILKGFDGQIKTSTPHFWEENEPEFLRSLIEFWFK